MVVWLIFYLVLLLGILGWGCLVIGVLFFRPRQRSLPIQDALILAAHSDDCVIGAGEYGIAAQQAGRQVSIVYLTCESSSEKAATRQQEAVAAWKLAGVSAESLEFLDLPQTDDMHRTSSVSIDTHDRARARIIEVLQALPQGAAVFLPAVGELHVDHRALREIALEAIIASGREDLLVLVYVEYNAYLSLFYSPSKAMLAISSLIPLVGRWAHKGRAPWSSGSFRAPHTGFVNGPPPCALPADQDRFALKKEMLNCFESQDLRLVSGFFGHPDQYQHVTQIQEDRKALPRGYVRSGSAYWGLTVLCMWLWICSTVGLLAYLVACLIDRLAQSMLLPPWIDRTILLLIAGGILVVSVAKYRGFASWLVRFSVVIGFVAGVF